MGLALGLSLVVSYLYRFTHTGYSYSRSFNISLIGVSMIVTMVMMVIGEQIALSLGLLGAISVIRFRTAVKDPRDLSYLFLAIAIGLACSTGNWVLAVGGGLAICVVLLALHFIHFGPAAVADYTLSFCLDAPEGLQEFQRLIPTLFRRAVLRSSAQVDSETFEYVYTVYPRTETPEDLITGLRAQIPGISRISLIQPETFVEV
jgi:uncharacterized membrane protein YhiD involved in acid resistance